MKRFLMGNEAIALGALAAGVRYAYGYPGTPSTEILETLAKEAGGTVYAEWSTNEKAALETAAGAAIAGGQCIVTMKQVGLNVAADPLMSLNYIGIKGALVVIVADDPGPISSQTEQDTRHFGQFAGIPVFDPSTPEEAYTMTADALACSHHIGRPVILRPTTRVCHSYAPVEAPPLPATGTPEETPATFTKDNGKWAIFPKLTYTSHLKIAAGLAELAHTFSMYEKNIHINKEHHGKKNRLGIACGGVSHQYVMETLQHYTQYRLLKIAAYPLPTDTVRDFLSGLDAALVIEELDPVIEQELLRHTAACRLPCAIYGKRTGTMPAAGEYTPALVRAAIHSFLREDTHTTKTDTGAFPPAAGTGLSAPIFCGTRKKFRSYPLRDCVQPAVPAQPELPAMPVLPAQPVLPARPPVLCAGCPHRAAFFAVKEAAAHPALRGRKPVYSGDIGCYTLGNAPPLDMLDTCLCMGAGLTMAQGLHRAEPAALNFAFIGDATFFHSGIPGLINAVYNGASTINIILDNRITAMTGGQPHPGTGKTLRGAAAPALDIGAIVRSLNVASVREVNAFDFERAKAAVVEAAGESGVRVLIFTGACAGRARGEGAPCTVHAPACTGCGRCVKKLGCPALSTAGKKAAINSALCTGCGLCKTVCAAAAIEGGRPC
ncbi:MAG: indolepyruvate ferredoxin oxidoreductase subunit alpha [Spirochaetaceae bacterium]|jgi:indolepyruvate ferredoxin oxidoreductase alpha subunit|nr:indolepyruvate ferredoxin oxidoreductase subunit alpha [Spirochaetaceae bacterium]